MPGLFLLAGGGLLRGFGFDRPVLGLFDDTSGLAAQSAQIIKLGAPHLAAADDLDRIQHRRIDRKHALDALAIGNLAHGEILVQPGAGAPDADAFIGLDTGALALDHLDVDDEGVAGLEIRDFLAGGELFDLLFFELLNEIHEEFSVGSANVARRAISIDLFGSASFYDKDWALSPFRAGILRWSAARQMGVPKVGPALAGEPFGLGPPPSGDPGVIAGGEDFRDGMALEELGPGKLRIFQQVLAEALLGAGRFLAHDTGNEPDAGVEQGKSR